MKGFKKLLSVVLILVLSLVATVSSAACNLSELKFDIINTTTKTETTVPEDDEKENSEPQNPTDEENDDEEAEIATALPDNVRFYQYVEQFDAAQSTLKLDVTSAEMLAAYIEYVNFYTVKAEVEITVTYANDFKDEYDKAKQSYDESEHVSIGYAFSITYSGKKGSYYLTSSSWETLATKTFDKDKEHVFPQTDYALKMSAPNERAIDYDDFKLNSVTKVLNKVYNSEQLRWAIQNGYKPNCVASSPAESVFNKAKEVLRSIVSDDMDDVTKLRAIYEWLALNVQYDNYAAEALRTDSEIKASEYDAWYAEGVFNNKKAVCEGYAKALIIMAGLEGIPAIFVTGNGHAWNRVLLDGKWYVVDATHADVHVGENEVFSYRQFLITDAEKTNRGYTSIDYASCAAVTEFNVFEKIKFKELLNEFDLVVGGGVELTQIISYADNVGAKGSTVEVFVNKDDADTFDKIWKSGAFVFCEESYISNSDLNGNAYYTFYLK